MNVRKKLDRFGQWSKEKVGAGDNRTDTPDEFKALETEMNLRHEGMEKLHSSVNAYTKALSKRSEGDAKDRQTPIAYLGSAMTQHGGDFEDNSKFGECLQAFGQANQRIARLQDNYASGISSSWLEACERSLAQMKDYQKARKQLESRRLAYDTSVAKMAKAKRDDYRVEDEVRSQKAKFEESTEDVYRRMQDIIEAENDNVADLYTFLEAELSYHDRCREILMRLRADWPMGDQSGNSAGQARRPAPRSRSNTLSRVPTTNTIAEDDDPYGDLERPSLPVRPGRAGSGTNSPFRADSAANSIHDLSPTTGAFPGMSKRTGAADAPTRPQINRTATEASLGRGSLKPVRSRALSDARSDSHPFADDDVDHSSSPAPSSYGTGGSVISRNTSWSTLNGGANGDGTTKKAPPPPPPSRSTKPKPPPPPMKRSALSESRVPQYTQGL